jgi:hypothetical protein
MSVELTQPERDLLRQLVDAALREIGPEIRRTQTYSYKDDLKQQRRTLLSLRERLSSPAEPLLISEV